MKLGLNLGYWGAGNDAENLELAREADRLGYSVVWAAEAYGSDAATVLSWVAAQTERIDVGSAIFQIPGRTPALTAMTAATLDTLSGGRFRLGLGVSGPQVSEGWHGVRFDKPLARTREYVRICRDAFARRGPITSDGPFYPLPLADGEGVTGLGKALKPTLHPVREDIPIHLAAEGPKNIALSAEIADGWMALFYSPQHEDLYRPQLAEGFAREGSRRSWADFEITATVPLIVHDDVEVAADMIRPMYALYFGGMGAKGANFHADVPVRMGHGDAVRRVQELYLEGRKDEAAAAVPTGLVEQLALIGPEAKIRHDLEAWRDSVVTTLLIGGDAAMVRRAAEIVLG